MSASFYDLTLERDRMEFSLGDTLDVKAGIVLAVITVLGTLSGTLLSTAGVAYSVLRRGFYHRFGITSAFASGTFHSAGNTDGNKAGGELGTAGVRKFSERYCPGVGPRAGTLVTYFV